MSIKIIGGGIKGCLELQRGQVKEILKRNDK